MLSSELNDLENELSPAENEELDLLLEKFVVCSTHFDWVYNHGGSHDDKRRASKEKKEVRMEIAYFCQELKGR